MKFKNIELSLYLGYETSIHKYTMKKFDYTNVYCCPVKLL